MLVLDIRDFTPIGHVLPDHDRPVLGLRPSGYQCSKLEVVTVRYMPDYRPLSPWRDISGDSITDSGHSIMAWCEADSVLQYNHR